MTLDYSLKNLSEIAARLSTEVEALKAAHKAEIDKLREALNVGVLNKEYAPLILPNINISQGKDRTYSWSDRAILSVSYPTDKKGLWGRYEHAERTFALDDEGLKQAGEFITSFLEKDKVNHAANLALRAENSRIVSSVCTIIDKCGFETETVKHDSRKRKNVTEHWDIDMRLSGASYHYTHSGLNLDTLQKTKLEDANRIVSAHKAEQKKKLDEENSKKLADPLLAEAVAYLTKEGKIAGKDFELVNAVSEANSLAYELEVESKKGHGPFRFGGDDYCERCEGWDGESHRCQCGNRRVGWTRGYGHSFKSPSAEPEVN